MSVERVVAALCVALACSGERAGPSDDPPGAFASISGRGYHTCGLTPTGASYCWGATSTTGQQLIPARVAMPAELTFTSLSAGGYYTCGWTPAGAAHCWGSNQFGQLGDGTTTYRSTPVAVVMPAGLTLANMSASIPWHLGGPHTCGLTPTGTAYCWGDNQFGQLGDGTTQSRLNPGAVATPTGVTFTSLATGVGHTCGLTPAEDVYCWGRNDEGQIGDGTTLTNRLTPVAVAMPSGITFKSLAVGGLHNCGLDSAGTAYCWGMNSGRIGDGTGTDRPSPTAALMPLGVTFTSLVAGYDGTCGLTPAGMAYCWGRNHLGQVGDGTDTSRYEPTAVVMPAGESFMAITAGWRYACGLAPRGAAYCWGLNNHGQLGDGTRTNRLAPVEVVQ